MSDIFKNSNNIPKLNVNTTPQKYNNKNLQDTLKMVAESNRAREERENENARNLQTIAENTKGIEQILEAVRKNNEINEQTFELFQEMNKIMIAKDEEEAKNIFFEVLMKAKDLKEGIDAATGLFTYGKGLLAKVFGVEE